MMHLTTFRRKMQLFPSQNFVNTMDYALSQQAANPVGQRRLAH